MFDIKISKFILKQVVDNQIYLLIQNKIDIKVNWHNITMSGSN